MKLNKPIITITIIILLVFNLIFFSFAQISKNILNEKFLTQLVDKFDLKKSVLNDQNIKNNINNYKYPQEVFNYIDYSSIDIVKKKIVNNILTKDKEFISEKDISYILNNSVYQYENYTFEDTFDYVKDDINKFSLNFSNAFKNDIVNILNFIKFLSNSMLYELSIIISLIFLTLIIFFEKRNGYLISSIICFIYALILYYLDSYFIKNMLLGPNNYLYFSNIDNLTISLDNIYIICLILSFVLLLIYIVKSIKKIMRDIRISSYGWR